MDEKKLLGTVRAAAELDALRREFDTAATPPPADASPVRKSRPFGHMAKMIGRLCWYAAAAVLATVMIFGIWPGESGRIAAAEQLNTLAVATTVLPGTSLEMDHAVRLWNEYPAIVDAKLVAVRIIAALDGKRQASEYLNDQFEKNEMPPLLAILRDNLQASEVGDRAAVMQRANEYLRNFGSSPEDYYNLSLATLDDEIALEFTKKAVDGEKDNTLFLRRMAHLCLSTGQLAEANRFAEELIRLGEDKLTWTKFHAIVLERQGRFAEAIRVGAIVTGEDPTGDGEDPAFYTSQGHAYLQVGEYEQAETCYRTALSLAGSGANQSWYKYRLATVYWILGEISKALECGDQFHQTVPEGQWSYAGIRSVLMYHDLGKPDAADRQLAAVLAIEKDDWRREILECIGSRRWDQLVESCQQKEQKIDDLSKRLGDQTDGQGRVDGLLKQLSVLREHVCEGYYYAGEICRLNKDEERARELFQRCKDTDVSFDLDDSYHVPMNEYVLAQWRLDSAR